MPGKNYAPNDAEEPGWVFTEVYDSGNRRGYLAVMRAERVAQGPVARIRLSHHAPFSYHGWWSEARKTIAN